jgi:hypothetical protein
MKDTGNRGRYREGGKGKNDKEWGLLKERILALEEDRGGWIMKEDRLQGEGKDEG